MRLQLRIQALPHLETYFTVHITVCLRMNVSWQYCLEQQKARNNPNAHQLNSDYLKGCTNNEKL